MIMPGLDALATGSLPATDSYLQKQRVGLLTNPTGTTKSGKSALQVLRARGADVRALFSPEHGPKADREGEIESSRDGALPIHSLYGATRRPTPEMLAGLDAVVFDLQDVGARFYTYSSTLFLLLEAAAENDVAVVVLDRPNPLGDAVEGPIIEPELRSFIGAAPLPVTHGLTLGELAHWFVAWKALDVELHVVPVQDWHRERWPQTGLEWRRPSPNLPDFASAAWYPGLCLLEFSNLCVGRGTDAPFQILASPDFDSRTFLMMWNGPEPVEAVEIVPAHAVFAGETCRGVRFGGEAPLKPVAFGLRVMATLRASHPLFPREQWQKAGQLLGSREILELLWNGELDSALALARRDAEHFREERENFLNYRSG